jgi:hypothetical protein
LPGVSADPNNYISHFAEGFNHEIKTFWGIFIVENDAITIEYYNSRIIEGLPAYLNTGVILNDTTFVLKEQKRSKDGSELQIIDETYHFKKFSPKPDSTNKYLK